MKYQRLLLAASLSLAMLTLGCASVGNETLRSESEGTISQKMVEGKTSKAEVRKMFGSPMKTTFTDGGLEIWTYEVSRRLAKDNDVHIFGGLPARSLRNQRFRDQGVTYHLTSTTPDAFAKRLLPKIRRSRQANRPDVARQSDC